ncbi:hypothetical protein [Actinomadura kijaniata]|uniref:hypothetical protein n=1 Tax=Actinomadura kijaniata TaxID=46161 RepID=UPI00083310C6|nr:hypothetical protein [Actinomadura kijaniata]
MPPADDATPAAEVDASPPNSPPNAYGCLFPSAGLHALGLVLALSPLHWTAVGYLLALLGANLLAITCGLARLPAGSPERPRAVRAADHQILYGAAATAMTVVVAAVTADDTAVWMGYLCLVPVGTGIYTRGGLLGWDRALPAGAVTALVVAVPLLCATGALFAHGTERLPALTVLLTIAGVGLLGVSLFRSRRGVVPGAVLLSLVCALFVTNFTGGLHAWLGVAGQRVDCRHVDTTEFRPRAASPEAVHHYRCGDRRIDVRGSEAGRAADGALLVDPTGVSDRGLRVAEAPGGRGMLWWATLAAVIAAMGAVLLLNKRSRRL